MNEPGEAAPLKKYHLESSGEKAAASMAGGRSGQRWRRGRGSLTLPLADTVQYTLPRNTSTVSFWSGYAQNKVQGKIYGCKKDTVSQTKSTL